MFLTILVCGCLVHWHWKASLISHLSIVLPFTPFSSLGQLLSSKYQITTKANGSNQLDFDQAKSGVYQELWLQKFKDKSKSLTSIEEQKRLILDGDYYTMYVDYNNALAFEEYQNCTFSVMNFKANTNLIAFAFPKKSPFLDLFNWKLQKMSENGELQKILTKYSKNDQDCGSQKGKPLGFENIAVMFLIMVSGIVSSIFICGAERILDTKGCIKGNVDIVNLFEKISLRWVSG